MFVTIANMPSRPSIERAFNDQIFPHMENLPVSPAAMAVRLRRPGTSILHGINEAIGRDTIGIQDWVRREVDYPRVAAEMADRLIGNFYPHVARLAETAETVAKGGHDGQVLRGFRLIGFRESSDSVYDRMAELVTRDPRELADYVMEEVGHWGDTVKPDDHDKIEKIITLGGERFQRVYDEVTSGRTGK